MANTQYLTVPHLDRRRLRRIFTTIRVDPVTGCWNWTGRQNGLGYGRTYLNHRQESIHRVMYAWLVGPIPRGNARDIMQLDHIACSNRGCANPAHLTLTTPRLNALRNDGPCARYAKQTHCKRGHELAGWNLMTVNRIHRGCRTCHNAAQKEMKRKRRRARGAKERIKQRQHRDSSTHDAP